MEKKWEEIKLTFSGKLTMKKKVKPYKSKPQQKKKADDKEQNKITNKLN